MNTTKISLIVIGAIAILGISYYFYAKHRPVKTVADDIQTETTVVPPVVEETPAEVTSRIAYYNGTEITGLAKKMENSVKEVYPNTETIAVTNATKRDYKENLIVDVSGTNAKIASNLASLLGGTVGELPDSETAPDADILIIIGQ